jgi:hypothetical protein
MTENDDTTRDASTFVNPAEQRTSTFASWLFDQLDDEEWGPLAREVEGDERFPEHGNRNIYEGYFETYPEDMQALFARAWDEYESSN